MTDADPAAADADRSGGAVAWAVTAGHLVYELAAETGGCADCMSAGSILGQKSR